MHQAPIGPLAAAISQPLVSPGLYFELSLHVAAMISFHRVARKPGFAPLATVLLQTL
jgi:hypothetical protein